MHTQYATKQHTGYDYTDEVTVLVTLLSVLFAIGIAVF